MILDRRYYERKNMETKGAEDVLGGADSWKNVDKTEGEHALEHDSRNQLSDWVQQNVHAKVASAVWRISDKCRFAVPTSPPQAFTSVWSVLRSGVRTDELADCVSRSNKQAAPGRVEDQFRHALFAAEKHIEQALHPVWLLAQRKFDPGPMVGINPIYYLVAWALGLADGGWLYQKTATSQIRWVRECWLILSSAAVSKDVKDFLPSPQLSYEG